MNKRRKRTPPKTIFIACEGINTEPIYFERLKEEIEEDGQYILTIYPDKREKKPKTDAMGLVREARSRSGEFDEVWAVFDKNGYTLHEKAFKEAARIIAGKKVHIAFSSISFEHWILLHFERNKTAFKKSTCKDKEGKELNCGTGKHPDDCIGSRCLTGYLHKKDYYPNYSKKSFIDTYTFLKNKTQNALENTAWLKATMRKELTVAKNNIFDLNPYCTVDELVSKLLGKSKTVIYADLSEVVQNKEFIWHFFRKDGYYFISITNQSSTPIIFNNVNLSNHFKIQSFDGKSLAINLAKTILIKPAQKEFFSLFSASDCNNGKLNFYWNNTHLISFFPDSDHKESIPITE